MTTPETEPKPKRWHLAARPEGENVGGENKGGLVVYLVSPTESAREEVGRVAFDRDASANPEISFKQALELLLKTGSNAADAINDLTGKAGELQ